jgi:hypothetical protein
MTLQRRAQALLDLVEADRSAQCEAIAAEARARAAAIVAAARADARARIRELFADERRRTHERVVAAQAKLDTRRRLHAQQRTAALLDLGWRRLPEALRGRWLADRTRRAWIDAVVALAARVLPRAPWRITHEPGWPLEERRTVGERIASEVGVAPAFVADPGIAAGITIRTSGNVIDGTLEGLLADRAEVGAKLLRHLEQST